MDVRAAEGTKRTGEKIEMEIDIKSIQNPRENPTTHKVGFASL